jgi:uncharacterized protein involved in oxidation of intracellular sulfur
LRRFFLQRFFGLPALALFNQQLQEKSRMKVLIKSAWGSGDPTQATFPFLHANAFAEAGHQVQIFLLGEAVTLLRSAVAGSIVPVGWPPLAEAMAKALEHKIPVHV